VGWLFRDASPQKREEHQAVGRRKRLPHPGAPLRSRLRPGKASRYLLLLLAGGSACPTQALAYGRGSDWASLSRGDASADGKQNEFRYAVQIEFLQDVSAVRFHGAEADIQKTGSFFVRAAFGNDLQHFALAIGK
jgi:hypothetical protein